MNTGPVIGLRCFSFGDDRAGPDLQRFWLRASFGTSAHLAHAAGAKLRSAKHSGVARHGTRTAARSTQRGPISAKIRARDSTEYVGAERRRRRNGQRTRCAHRQAPRLLARRIAIAAAALLMVGGVAGCGGSTPSAVVVRVGDALIDRAAVDHWARAITRGSSAGVSSTGVRFTPREQALDFLISSDWLIGEAAEQRLAVSDRAIEHALEERIGSSPSGNADFQKELSFTGQTVSDVRLEAKTALAAAMLRETLSKRVPKVTRSAVADFYRRQRLLFRRDRRVVDLIEGIESPDAAIALGREIGAGSRFTTRAVRETVPRPPLIEAERRENRKLVRAIFATRLGKIGDPVSYDTRWVLLVVRAEIPGSTKRFAEVETEIARYLSERRRHAIIAKFLEAYRAEWTARTSCRAGFVVQKCSQYRGPAMPEGNPLAGT
jgi:foldase protein PrsA